MDIIFQTLVYPGLLTTVVLAFFLEWVIRKVKARIQARVGPPIYQPLVDFLKLLMKDDLTPSAAHPVLFAITPIIAFSTLFLAMLFVPFGSASSVFGNVGDLIVFLYLLVMVSVMIVVSGSVSSNPFAAIGANREVMLTLAYEPPLVVSTLAAAIAVKSLSVESIVSYQLSSSWLILRLPFAFIAFLICMQANLGRLPFDIPEAETEIIHGPFIEYSGRNLAFYKLVQSMKLVVMPSLAVALFFPGPYTGSPIVDFGLQLVKILSLIGIVALIDSIFPRAKIDQTIRFFWKYVLPLALIDLVRVVLGI